MNKFVEIQTKNTFHIAIRNTLWNITVFTNGRVQTNRASQLKDDGFYKRLDKTYEEFSKHDGELIIGDTSCPVIGKENLHTTTNDYGLRLVNFAAARGIAICSKYFSRKNVQKHTLRYPNGDTWTIEKIHKMIDLIWEGEEMPSSWWAQIGPLTKHVTLLGERHLPANTEVIFDQMAATNPW